MINITKQGNNVIVTSDNPNSFNISNGELSVPLNTIYYVLDDESDFIQFNSTEEGNILFNGTIGQIQVNGNIVTRDNILMELDNVFNSAANGGEGGTAGVLSINGYQGNINIKTVNGTSLIGSGDYDIDAEKLYYNGIMQQSNGYLLYNKAKSKGDSIKFKTINGESLIGSGDITIEGESTDLSDYYTKQETNSLIPSTYVSRINDFNLYTKDAPYKKILLQYVNSDSETIITKEIILEWSGTQSEYDALGTYDDNITYNIIEG